METRPIDVYRNSLSDLRQLVKEFQEWSARSPLRHQFILWHGADDPPTTEGWETLLSDVGIFPFEASTPDEQAQFEFLPDASRCNSFRWRETPKLREGDYDVRWDFEQLAQDAFVRLGSMLRAHELCLPDSECRVPKDFCIRIDPPFGMTYAWLEVLYDYASKWPEVSGIPACIPTARELVGKTAKAKLVESQDVWMLSADAITRWLPPDIVGVPSSPNSGEEPGLTVASEEMLSPERHDDLRTLQERLFSSQQRTIESLEKHIAEIDEELQHLDKSLRASDAPTGLSVTEAAKIVGIDTGSMSRARDRCGLAASDGVRIDPYKLLKWAMTRKPKRKNSRPSTAKAQLTPADNVEDAEDEQSVHTLVSLYLLREGRAPEESVIEHVHTINPSIPRRAISLELYNRDFYHLTMVDGRAVFEPSD